MMSGINRIAALCLMLLVAACSGQPAVPVQTQFIVPASVPIGDARRAEMFVDANGTFYPNGWQAHVPLPKSWKAGSLLNSAVTELALRPLIPVEEKRQLDQIAAFAAGKGSGEKGRVFILVHGFNNRPEEAMAPFDSIEARLNLRDGDRVLRFHWDGLTAKGLGAGKIWFNAVGNSQLAGTRGLRRILNRIHGKQVYLIAHSRGASVILSALSDPPYDPRFREATDAVSLKWPPELATPLFAPEALDGKTGNTYHILLAAAAIDEVDFCDPLTMYPKGQKQAHPCSGLRALPARTMLRYTVNPHDWVLNKGVGLSRYFNPTGLGLTPGVGTRIGERGGYNMCGYVFAEPQRFHAFERYIRSPEFEAMLVDEGIWRADMPYPSVPPAKPVNPPDCTP
jgi:hypothetical protein